MGLWQPNWTLFPRYIAVRICLPIFVDNVIESSHNLLYVLIVLQELCEKKKTTISLSNSLKLSRWQFYKGKSAVETLLSKSCIKLAYLWALKGECRHYTAQNLPSNKKNIWYWYRVSKISETSHSSMIPPLTYPRRSRMEHSVARSGETGLNGESVSQVSLASKPVIRWFHYHRSWNQRQRRIGAEMESTDMLEVSRRLGEWVWTREWYLLLYLLCVRKRARGGQGRIWENGFEIGWCYFRDRYYNRVHQIISTYKININIT